MKKIIDLGIVDLKELKAYISKLVELGKENGTSVLFESNPMFHTTGFWEWYDTMAIIALASKVPVEETAKTLHNCIKRVADNPGEQLEVANKRPPYLEYIKAVTNKLNELGMNEFVETNPFLKDRFDFVSFVENLIRSAFNCYIDPIKAAETIYKEITAEMDPQKFMESVDFGDVKH